MTSEFDLIDSLVDALGDAARGPGVVVGPGDDAAVLTVPPSHQLVVSTDTLIAGRHYPVDSAADAIGYRGMAVAASDLAAMGATPAWATVSLAADRLCAAWLRRHARGIAAAARQFGLAVVGGNLARGPTSVAVTVHGHVPAGRAILRAGARPGDCVYVTGALGGARLALGMGNAALVRCSSSALDEDSPERRYWKPQPRLDVGVGLRGIASAAIDISDGLASDLEHLCRAGGVACDVDLARLPIYPGCDPLAAVSGGDDYELAFTAPPGAEETLRSLARHVATARPGPPAVRWFHNGAVIDVAPGYRHF